MKKSLTTRGRGIPRKPIREIIKKDLEINKFDRNLVLDKSLWRNFIHVADLTQWDMNKLLLQYYFEVNQTLTYPIYTRHDSTYDMT